jgi:hypothetical protein
MAMEVILDNLDGVAASYHLSRGWAITRVATVTGIELTEHQSNEDLVDTAELFTIAVAAVVSEVGNVGSAIPGIVAPTYLEEFLPEVLSTDTVRVRIVYRGFPKPVLEYQTSLSHVESNLDINNNIITVQYSYPEDYALDPLKMGKTLQQGGMISRPVPEPCFTVRAIVRMGSMVGSFYVRGTTYIVLSDTTATACMTLLGLYVGTVNKDPFTFGYVAGAARSWMCVAAGGTSRDGGLSYEAYFTIQFREWTWDQQVVYINPDDGKPPVDLAVGVGYKMVRAAKESTFPSWIIA